MNNAFYRAFEDRHRGSRELIKSRLTAYLPFLIPLAAQQQPSALDLGCGRGEWLELLAETGFSARGVDLDEGMLAACRERGLQVETADALDYLRAQPDASLALVSAFHLIEHVPFDAVQDLITEALRALQPGGLLIMETPNPENLMVATSGFYMDPSHLHPIPPLLLEFVVEFNGFARHKVVRLQESPQLHDALRLDLINVLNGASPDYSVVAQKAGDLAVIAPFDSAFGIDYGLDLATLAQRYQAQQDGLHGESRAALARLDERISATELGNKELLQRTLDSIGEAQSVTRQIQLELAASQQRERGLEATLHAQVLREAETRAATYLTQAQEAGLRSLQAEQRAMEAEQRASDAEQRANEAESRAAQAERLFDEQSIQSESVAGDYARQVNELAAERTRQAEQGRLEAEQQVQHLHQQLQDVSNRMVFAEQQVSALHASTSWRVTRPARAAMSLLKRPLGVADVARMIAARNRARASRLLLPLVRNLVRHPGARAFAMRTLARFPALEGRVRALAYRALHGQPAYVPAAPAAAPGQLQVLPPELPRSAQKVYAQLQRSAHSDD